MLQKLSIKHFAIIDALDLEFRPGFNILSGETGAGKSIILQAIHLITGGRGYSELIRSGEECCEVKAEFYIAQNSDLFDFLKKQGSLFSSIGPLLFLRRVLQRSGKSRVWVNDQPTTVGLLQEMKHYLLDLVSQHESQRLLEEQMPLYTLDSFGGHKELLRDYQKSYQDYLRLKEELSSFKKRAEEAKEKEDLFRFQLREIQEAELKVGEEEQLLQEKRILANSSRMNEGVSNVEGLLYSHQNSVTELLGKSGTALSQLQGIDPLLDAQAKILHSHTLELEELARFFQSYLKKIEFDPERLNAIETRLAQLSALKKKHGNTVELILQKALDLEKKMVLLDDFEDSFRELEKELSLTQNHLTQKAALLSAARKKAGLELSKQMEKELASLAMHQNLFEVRVSTRILSQEESQGEENMHFTADGVDRVEFLISPNRGEEPKPLALIVSGGELSRILLALKGILNRSQAVSTYVFDEVDAGIGGAIAEVVGQKLKKISQNSQVICITHLPQIAACADVHFQISKREQKQRITTQVKVLNAKQREEEIARMIAGVQITEKARLHAKELIEHLRNESHPMQES